MLIGQVNTDHIRLNFADTVDNPMALQPAGTRHEVVPLKVNEVTDVPGGIKRPPGDKRATYHSGNPLSLEKDVKRGHKGQGSQEHKETEFHSFPFEAR